MEKIEIKKDDLEAFINYLRTCADNDFEQSTKLKAEAVKLFESSKANANWARQLELELLS